MRNVLKIPKVSPLRVPKYPSRTSLPDIAKLDDQKIIDKDRYFLAENNTCRLELLWPKNMH